MVKIAILLAVALALTGFVAAPAAAQVFGPFAILSSVGKTCAEIFASSIGVSNQFILEGRTKYVDGDLADLVVLGALAVVGANLLWGFEAFPTPAFPVALKLGGLLALSTLTGNASGYVFTPGGLFLLSLLFALQDGPCPPLQTLQ